MNKIKLILLISLLFLSGCYYFRDRPPEYYETNYDEITFDDENDSSRRKLK